MDNKMQEQLNDLANQRNDKEYAWIRHVTLMGATVLGFLIALHKEKSPTEYTHIAYCLSITTIALGILFGTIYGYADVSTFHRLTKSAGKKIHEGQRNFSVSAYPNFIFRFARFLALFFFFTSIPSLIAYAILLDTVSK